MKALPVPSHCLQCGHFAPPRSCKVHDTLNLRVCDEFTPWSRARNGLARVAKLVGVLVGIITVLVSLRLLPWATAADLDTHKRDNDRDLARLERRLEKLDELHALFFPHRP